MKEKWTKDACYNAAKECSTKTEFQKKFSQGYQVALANGWLDEYIWFKAKRGSN